MAKKSGYNITSYTSGYSTIPEMPSEKAVAEVASMMSDLEYKVNDVRELE